MRIGLDLRYTGPHFPGIGRYSQSLARALAELELGHELVLLLPPGAETAPPPRPGLRLVTARSGPFSPAQQLELPRLARALRLDLLHSPYFIKPYFGLPCPSVLTVYDLLGWRFPRQLSARGRLLYRLTMGLAIRRSAALITSSQASREDIAHVYRLPRERIAVTPLAAGRRFQPQPEPALAELRRRLGLPDGFVLYLGSNKPHKNLERLVRAWERVLAEGRAGPAELLLIAGRSDPRHPELPRFVAERGLGSRVRFLPDVEEADLPALYSAATVFAFPSYYEGFGLPPLEAMACGAPVLCAYASSLPEVVGSAALTVDPFSAIDMAEGLGRLLGSPPLRRRLSEAGLRRARQFSWRRTALETLAVYERAARA